MIVSPIPLQEKVAELEQRIVRLEEQANVRITEEKNGKKTIAVKTPWAKGDNAFFGPHWRKMWEEFHLAMKEMFE